MLLWGIDMSKFVIQQNKLKGTITLPPSKSLAHRAIIAASLARGRSVIKNIEFIIIFKTINYQKSISRFNRVDFEVLCISNEVESVIRILATTFVFQVVIT